MLRRKYRIISLDISGGFADDFDIADNGVLH